MIDVRVQAGDFEPGRQVGRLGDLRRAAVAAFVGRAQAGDDVAEIRNDQHSALARADLARIAAEAEARWPLAGIILIHRHGLVEPCGRVLFAGVAASDAEAAASACAWLVGAVRTRAPFWRRDRLAGGGERWFEPGQSD